MKSKLDTKSIFGNVPEIFSLKVRKWERRGESEKRNFLHVDDKDGHLALYSLTYGLDVTVYEPNKNLLYGGKIDVPVLIPNSDNYIFINKTVEGLVDRANLLFGEKKLKLNNKNFYKSNCIDKYIFVTACRSLNREENKDISMEDKINKLKRTVDYNGYLYIEYYLANKSDDYELYPVNSYLREYQLENYFDKSEWTIISNNINIEKELITPFNKDNKDVAVGYFIARRRPTPVVKEHKYKFEYVDNKRIPVKRNYIINGVVECE